MQELQNSTIVKTLTAKELATKMGLSPKRLSQILRAEYPRETKEKNWEIPMDVAKRVEKAYRARVKARERKSLAQTKKELERS